VIVVGAGVAGLEAADRLDRAGLKVLVVEARPYVGGRIQTHRVAGWPAPVEAGAEFVHGTPAVLLRKLRAARARLVELKPTHVLVQQGRVRSAERAWREAQERVAQIPAEDTAFDVVLAREARRHPMRPEVRYLLRGFVEGFNAADAARVSARGLREQAEASEEEHGERMFRVRDGYDALPERLARRLRERGRVLLGLTVTTVRRGDDGVEVLAKDAFGGAARRLRARAALVTVPLGALLAGAIRFQPALPRAKRDAIARLAMGRVIKVVVRWRGPLGGGPLAKLPRSATFFHVPRAPVPTWWVPTPAPPSSPASSRTRWSSTGAATP
jgi:monoamine oxidase